MRKIKEFFSAFLGQVLYAFVYSVGVVIGWLPDFVWRALACVIYVVIYKLVRYRLKVVRLNLANSFPEKSVGERLKIEKRFYLFLSDVFIESLAVLGVSKKRMEKKMVFKDAEEFERVSSERSVIITMAHYGSWEWTSFYASRSKCRIVPVYHKLESEWAEKLFLKMRMRFGSDPVTMKLVGRKLIGLRNENIGLVLIADQSPLKTEKNEWTTFLNQDTKFFSGPEVFALKYHMPVYFFDIRCVKRGYYEGVFHKLYDGDSEVPQYHITRAYAERLEHRIKEEPEFWAWSHRRWKRKKRS